jgi:hypothetical protein
LLSFEQRAADPGAALVGPSRFHNHAAQVGITGFGDAAAR